MPFYAKAIFSYLPYLKPSTSFSKINVNVNCFCFFFSSYQI